MTKRKRIPALCNLAKSNLLPRDFAIVGVARVNMSADEFRQKIGQDIREFATSRVEGIRAASIAVSMRL